MKFVEEKTGRLPPVSTVVTLNNYSAGIIAPGSEEFAHSMAQYTEDIIAGRIKLKQKKKKQQDEE